MRYKLAFSNSQSGPFRVTAAAIGIPSQPVTVHYKNDETFIRLLDRAELGADEHARLVYATMVAATSPNMPACCEEVVLDVHQLKVLKLNASSQQVA